MRILIPRRTPKSPQHKRKTLIKAIDESKTDINHASSSENEAQERAKSVLLSLEISEQAGIEQTTVYRKIPGRFALMPFSLASMLASVLGFSVSLFEFAGSTHRYLFPLAVFQCCLFVLIALYHSSHRAQRLALAWIHALMTLLITALVVWAFYDLIQYPLIKEQSPSLLYISMFSFALIPVIMLAHLLYFGRSFRYLPLAESQIPKQSLQQLTTESLAKSSLPKRSQEKLASISKPNLLATESSPKPETPPETEQKNNP